MRAIVEEGRAPRVEGDADPLESTSHPPDGHAPRWCLLRFPVLPMEPSGRRADQEAVLDAAIAYALAFNRGEQGTTATQKRIDAVRRRYQTRARHRSTPFGLFAVSVVADVGDRAAATVIDLLEDVRLHFSAAAVASGRWFPNPTLSRDGDRWVLVHPRSGSLSSAPDAGLVRDVDARRHDEPRSPARWREALSPEGWERASRTGLLVEELRPPPIVTPAPRPAGVADPTLGAFLASGDGARVDGMTDAVGRTRVSLPGHDVEALLEAGRALAAEALPHPRLDGVRRHLAQQYSGGAIPLVWLLGASPSHPLGSWRHEVAPPPAEEVTGRLFVAAGARDMSFAGRLTADAMVSDWEDDDTGAPPAGSAAPRRAMAVGALLAEPVFGARAWLKGTIGGHVLGPAGRLAGALGLTPPLVEPLPSEVEISWVTPGVRGALVRRPDSGLRRMNVNTPARAGDLTPSDILVVLHEGRLRAIGRDDGRFLDWHHDSPLSLSDLGNPPLVQLLGLLMEESGSVGIGADPLPRLRPGEVIPRLRSGRCLLARRGVSLGRVHRRDLQDLLDDAPRLLDVLSEIGLGSAVEVSESADRVMRLDLDDGIDRGWLARRLRRPGPLGLHEVLPVATPVVSTWGRHSHEVWVPWETPAAPVRPVSPERMIALEPRSDGEWTTHLVYAPDTVVERWLGSDSVLAAMRTNDLFYIRYHDGRPHVRIRVRGSARSIPAVADLAEFVARATPHQPTQVLTGDWIPEDHRYGGPRARASAVAHFCADSAWWASRLGGRPDVGGRVTWAAARVAAWSWSLDGPGALEGLCRVHSLDPRLPAFGEQRAWMDAYRRNRTPMTELFEEMADEDHSPLAFLLGLDLDARDQALRSMTHMTVNRALPVALAVSHEPEIVMAAARLVKARLSSRPARTGARDGMGAA